MVVVTAADSSLCGGSLLEGTRAKPPLKGVRSPTPHGRGGSVSRRDHNQATGPRTNLSGGTNEAEAAKPNASRSSGGSAREELLSEKLPPSQPPHVRGGSVSRRGLNQVYRRPHLTLRRNPLCRSTQLKRQPLFGREREGGASLREAASLATPASPSRLFRRGPGGGRFSIREAPSPGVPRTPTPVSSDVRRGGGPGGCGELRAWARDRQAAENLPASVDQGIAPLRPRCRCHGQPRKLRSVNVGSRSWKSPLTAGYASTTTVMHRRESTA